MHVGEFSVLQANLQEIIGAGSPHSMIFLVMGEGGLTFGVQKGLMDKAHAFAAV